MSPRERQILIEHATTAWRPRDPSGGIDSHPTWHDLDESERLEVYRATVLQRVLEASLDREGLSTTARAVLARIRPA